MIKNGSSVTQNRKAGFNYEILEKLECGIELRGWEIKSMREGHSSIQDAWISVENGEMFIKGMYIPHTDKTYRYDKNKYGGETRVRKLIAHKCEICKFGQEVSQSGLTIVPLSIYINNRGRAKVIIALTRGKKTYDKRRDIKERDIKREYSRKYKM